MQNAFRQVCVAAGPWDSRSRLSFGFWLDAMPAMISLDPMAAAAYLDKNNNNGSAV
jgi:hypothetical protein